MSSVSGEGESQGQGQGQAQGRATVCRVAQPRPTGGERLPSATFGPERAEVGQTTLLLPHELDLSSALQSKFDAIDCIAQSKP